MNEKNKIELMKYINQNNFGEVSDKYTFKQITTLKVGGKINLFYLPNTEDNLIEVLKYLKRNQIDYLIIGNGSNILASDQDYDGVVISLKKIANQFVIEKREENKYLITVNAGCSTKKFSDFLLDYSLTGAEEIGSIPATVGGIVAMNASCYDFLAEKYLNRVLVIIGDKLKWVKKEDLNFSYRSSKILKEKLILLKVEFIFEKGNYQDILKKVNDVNKKRKISQPVNMKSAGSAFKNGLNYKAWKVIEELGLRGYQIGDAMVSNNHTNFLINVGNAKSDDFYQLIKYIQKEAKSRLNIDLEQEWVMINF